MTQEVKRGKSQTVERKDMVNFLTSVFPFLRRGRKEKIDSFKPGDHFSMPVLSAHYYREGRRRFHRKLG